MTPNLTPAQVRTILAISAAGTADRCSAPPRADVLRRLKNAGMTTTAARDAALTDEGHAVAARIGLAGPDATPTIRPAVAHAAGRTYLPDVLVTTRPAGAPDGALSVLEVGLSRLDDRDRVAVLAFLADHRGTAWLAAVKDEIVVANRAGRTYAQTAEALGLSTTAVNKAVSRRAARRADAGLDI